MGTLGTNGNTTFLLCQRGDIYTLPRQAQLPPCRRNNSGELSSGFMSVSRDIEMSSLTATHRRASSISSMKKPKLNPAAGFFVSGQLPKEVRRNYQLCQQNPNHPSLHFRRLKGSDERFTLARFHLRPTRCIGFSQRIGDVEDRRGPTALRLGVFA